MYTEMYNLKTARHIRALQEGQEDFPTHQGKVQ
jgi:hypothetical protein